MKQSEHFKILGKKYPRNLQFKSNTVYFEYNGEKFEIDVLYLKNHNRYAFVQYGNEEEFIKKLSKTGLLQKDMQEEFLSTLNKYSRLGKMKEWD